MLSFLGLVGLITVIYIPKWKGINVSDRVSNWILPIGYMLELFYIEIMFYPLITIPIRKLILLATSVIAYALSFILAYITNDRDYRISSVLIYAINFFIFIYATREIRTN